MKGGPKVRTAVERASGPLDRIFVFIAGHLLGPLARKKGPDERGNRIVAVHRFLGGVESPIDHVFPAGPCDARKALEARTGEPVRHKAHFFFWTGSREHT